MSSESESSPVAYTLKIISANDLPLRWVKFLGERNIIAKAKVEGSSVQTEACMWSSSAEWNETFSIEARDTISVLLLRLSGSTHGTSLNCGVEILISELLQRCRYGQDTELDLHGIKSGRQGRIKIRLSLSRSGSWSDDEAQCLALVLTREPNTAMSATGGCIDAVDGLLAISFPTPPAMAAESIQNVLGQLENFMRIAGVVAEVHPYAKGAWDVLSAAYKIIVAQVAIDQSVADLFQTMQDVCGFVDGPWTRLANVAGSFRNIAGMDLEADFLERIWVHLHQRKSQRWQRVSPPSTDNSTPVSPFILLLSAFAYKQMSHLFWRIQHSIVDLGSLSCCLPGTRRDAVDGILEWASQPSQGDSSNFLWLYGVAGIGKSTVAATVATHFSKMGRLGGFVGFDRAFPGQSQAATAVKALAGQLAEHDGRLRALIAETIKDCTKGSVLRASLAEQFDRLMVQTLALIPALAGEGPIVIVLDGLYECGRPDDWASLVELLVDQTDSLPSNLRFIITSRTVDGILDAVTGTVLHSRIRIRELRSNSHSDISAYFTLEAYGLSTHPFY